MRIETIIQDFETAVSKGGYGGTRYLSPESELLLLSIYQYALQASWVNEGGQDLTEEQKSTIDRWASRAESELMTSTMIGQVVWSMVSPVNAPEGWLLADGSFFTADDYPELADVIGGEWQIPSPPGVPRTYQLPSLVGAYASGVASSSDLKSLVGSNEVTLTEAQMPQHSHSLTVPFLFQVPAQAGAGFASLEVSSTTALTASAGSNQPHENRPLTQYLYPYVVAQ